MICKQGTNYFDWPADDYQAPVPGFPFPFGFCLKPGPVVFFFCFFFQPPLSNTPRCALGFLDFLENLQRFPFLVSPVKANPSWLFCFKRSFFFFFFPSPPPVVVRFRGETVAVFSATGQELYFSHPLQPILKTFFTGLKRPGTYHTSDPIVFFFLGTGRTQARFLGPPSNVPFFFFFSPCWKAYPFSGRRNFCPALTRQLFVAPWKFFLYRSSTPNQGFPINETSPQIKAGGYVQFF